LGGEGFEKGFGTTVTNSTPGLSSFKLNQLEAAGLLRRFNPPSFTRSIFLFLMQSF